MGFIRAILWVGYFLIYGSFAGGYACQSNAGYQFIGRDHLANYPKLQFAFDAFFIITGLPLFMQLMAAGYRNDKRNFFRKYGRD